MKQKLNILLTCAGGELIPQTIKYIKKNHKFNVKVVGVDLNLNAIGKTFCDHFYQICKPENPKRYIKEINAISKKHNINIIIPTSDEESLCLAKHRNLIERKNLKITNADFSTLKIFSNKVSTYKKLEELGIKTPKFLEVKSFKELLKLIKIKKDFVLKPAVARGGRDVYIVSNKGNVEESLNNGRELHCNLNIFKSKYAKKIKNYPLILMEKLVPPTYDLDILAYHGLLKKIILRRRIIPHEPNSGHIFEKLPSKILEDFKKIAKNLKLNWLYDCDLMKDKNGNFKILEINPRQSGSVSVTCDAGVNLFEDLFLMYFDKKIKSKYGLKKKIIIKPVKNLINLQSR